MSVIGWRIFFELCFWVCRFLRTGFLLKDKTAKFCFRAESSILSSLVIFWMWDSVIGWNEKVGISESDKQSNFMDWSGRIGSLGSSLILKRWGESIAAV